MMDLHIDFETYSEVNLKSVGAYRYATDPTTEVLMLAWGLEGFAPQVWEPHKNSMPFVLESYLRSEEVTIKGFNVLFERLILKHVLGIGLPVERFKCTMVKAYALGFSGSLGDVQDQIGFGKDVRKLKEGRALILRFCKPQPKSHNVRRWNWENDPQGWAKFRAYCTQDVVAETELDMWLSRYSPMSKTEWKVWQLDQRINDAGVPINTQYAAAALKMHAKAKHDIKEHLKSETGLSNPLSPTQMREWLAWRGIYMPNMRADTIRQVDAGDYQPILGDYSSAVATAPTKYKKFLECEVDGRVHGMFQYAGAGRTRRWAGRLVQLQNLKRGDVEVPVLTAIHTGRLDKLKDLGDPMDLLAKGVRSTIEAPKGYEWNVSDLSSIESRVLGWVTNCGRMNRVFESGKDTYKDFGTVLFQKLYDDITKEERTFAKPPVLGAGYGLGPKGMKAYALSMGVHMTDAQAEHAVYTFRDTYIEVVCFWNYIMDQIRLLLTTGTPTKSRMISMYLTDDRAFMRIVLPSGRELSYYQPMWQQWITPMKDPAGRPVYRDSFTYMGQNRFTNKWERIAAHHGLVTENIVQAIARDVLAVWMLRAELAFFDIRFHVHDELGCLETHDRIEELNALIKQPIPWAEGLLLDAEGYTAKRYKK